jgi:hypothetical protein
MHSRITSLATLFMLKPQVPGGGSFECHDVYLDF